MMPLPFKGGYACAGEPRQHSRPCSGCSSSPVGASPRTPAAGSSCEHRSLPRERRVHQLEVGAARPVQAPGDLVGLSCGRARARGCLELRSPDGAGETQAGDTDCCHGGHLTGSSMHRIPVDLRLPGQRRGRRLVRGRAGRERSRAWAAAGSGLFLAEARAGTPGRGRRSRGPRRGSSGSADGRADRRTRGARRPGP